MTGRGRRLKQLLDDQGNESIVELERGNIISHSVENSLSTCRKTDYVMNEMISKVLSVENSRT